EGWRQATQIGLGSPRDAGGEEEGVEQDPAGRRHAYAILRTHSGATEVRWYGPEPVPYFDWHEQPGYWADVTHHFPSDAKLLDIGCGTAWLAQHFSSYTGIDGSAEAVEIAKGMGREVVRAN